MAVLQFIRVAPAAIGTAAAPIYAATLGASANSPVITTGFDMIIRIVASGPINIRFGNASTLTNAGATDILLPANVIEIWDMGHQNNGLSIWSQNASTQVTVSQVSKN